MSQVIRAHFDGQVIVPDEPVQLPVGQALEIHVALASPQPGRFSDLAQLAVNLPDAPADLSDQHDHYLYGTPKR